MRNLISNTVKCRYTVFMFCTTSDLLGTKSLYNYMWWEYWVLVGFLLFLKTIFWLLMQVQTSYLLKNSGHWLHWTGGHSMYWRTSG